jgi:hypothetical protein
MSGAIHLLPQYAFMAWCLVKHSDNVTLPRSQESETCPYPEPDKSSPHPHVLFI